MALRDEAHLHRVEVQQLKGDGIQLQAVHIGQRRASPLVQDAADAADEGDSPSSTGSMRPSDRVSAQRCRFSWADRQHQRERRARGGGQEESLREVRAWPGKAGGERQCQPSAPGKGVHELIKHRRSGNSPNRGCEPDAWEGKNVRRQQLHTSDAASAYRSGSAAAVGRAAARLSAASVVAAPCASRFSVVTAAAHCCWCWPPAPPAP